MSKEAKDAVIRFRAMGSFKARLEAIAAKRKVSISDLMAEALEAVYPELADEGVASASPRSKPPPLVEAIREQTNAITRLIEVMHVPKSRGQAIAQENSRQARAAARAPMKAKEGPGELKRGQS
jgi:hypothetical protein